MRSKIRNVKGYFYRSSRNRVAYKWTTGERGKHKVTTTPTEDHYACITFRNGHRKRIHASFVPRDTGTIMILAERGLKRITEAGRQKIKGITFILL